jgi:hypothetical protein
MDIGAGQFYRGAVLALTDRSANTPLTSHTLVWNQERNLAYRNGARNDAAGPQTAPNSQITSIGIGHVGGVNPLGGWVLTLYWPRALTAAEVAAVSAAIVG